MPDLDALLRQRPAFTLEELADVANELLPDLLPDDPVDSRVTSVVNPRLIRHYVGEEVLDPTMRDGKRAVYTVDHLLQLLAFRRLLADGASSSAIGPSLRQRDRAELRAIAEGRSGADSAATRPPADAASTREAARTALSAIRSRSQAGNDASTGVIGPTPGLVAHRWRKDGPTPTEPTTGAIPARSWERLDLFDGVELHVRSDVRFPSSAQARQRVIDHVVRVLVRFIQGRTR